MLKIQDKFYFKRSLLFLALSLATTIISLILAILFHPSDDIFKNIANKVPSALSNASGFEKVWLYIINNAFEVPFQMLILALIPLPFLYLVNYLSTSIIVGIVYGFAINLGAHNSIPLIISSIPHHILEMSAMCIVVSGLFKLNSAIIRKISNLFRSNKKERYSFKFALLNLIKAYVFYSLPLYILAAFAETYVTSFIYELLT